jgi:ABC-2 type transport system ATP-binding protein
VTIFLTTQYLEEADQLADRIAVLDGGQIVAQGSPAQLKQQVAEQRLDLTVADLDTFRDIARSLGARALLADESRLTLGVATDGSAAGVRALLDDIDPRRNSVQKFTVHTATLDDVFLTLTGHAAQEKETADV